MNGNKHMLFAGWEVRIVKNCDRGLEIAVRGRRHLSLSNDFVLNSRKRYCDRGQR